jgi:uncharacterized OB-fold protein
LNIEPLPDGIVYTETVVHSAPERYLGEAPYQIGIVEIPGLGRVTARILAQLPDAPAKIGDRVVFTRWRDGVPYFTPATHNVVGT